jgi:hypothetical protein
MAKKNEKIQEVKIEEVKDQNVKNEKAEKVKKNEVKNEKKVEKKEEAKIEKNIKETVMSEEFMKTHHEKAEGLETLNFVEYFEKRKEQLEKNENIEFVMLTQESRKIYYLFEVSDNEFYYIGEFKSIMENKIFTMKVASILNREMKIHYFKPGRKNQSSEKINKKSYLDKLEKYSNI